MLFALLFLFVSCTDNKEAHEEYIRISGFAQGTTYNVTYKDSLNRNFQIEIDSMLRTIDNSVSTYKETSLISKFNNLKDTNTWFELDEIFYQNLLISKYVFNLTQGAFDPTVAPLYSYLKFDDEGIQFIDTTVIDSIRNYVGLDLVELNEKTKSVRKKNPNITLSFNAVAQGFSVDFIAVNLLEMGIENYLIEVGGELLSRGVNPNGKEWNIGIDAPNEKSKPGENFQKIVSLKNEALATSGNYRKFFKIGDKQYSHTLNPLTGFPVEHNLLSVSVKTSTCAEADAYATAFMVLGAEKSLELINNGKIDVEAYFISSNHSQLEEVVTSNF